MSIDVLFSVVEVEVDSAWSPAPRRTPFRSLDAVYGETPMRHLIDALSPVRPGCRQYLASVLVVLFATVAVIFVGPVMAQAPAAPTAVTAAAGSSQVTVRWSAVTGATSYTLYRDAAYGSFAVDQSGLAATSVVENGLTNGTVYGYYVVALNGSSSSYQSQTVYATPGGTPAAAPTDLTASPMPTTGMTTQDMTDKFKDFFMFLPPPSSKGAAVIEVPVGELDWSATGHWTETSGLDPTKSVVTNPGFKESNTYPVWKRSNYQY